MGSCAAPSAKGDDKFITTDYLQQCPFRVGGTDFGVLNDDVFNSENRLSARGFLPPHRAVI
ncbi:hypothetical protein BVA04_26880 (plasmid) [Salmonella enterica subsp. enterica serovar Typhimurium]|nr:hypothetical protein BVA04_26880 [Salmonella enterica subsp. enterica serovar Typhimurium]